MNELKILGVDANIYFKNIEFYIKNPRKTLFKLNASVGLFHKHEYVNIKKEQGKTFIDKRFYDFHKAVKVIVSSKEEASAIYNNLHLFVFLSSNLLYGISFRSKAL